MSEAPGRCGAVGKRKPAALAAPAAGGGGVAFASRTGRMDAKWVIQIALSRTLGIGHVGLPSSPGALRVLVGGGGNEAVAGRNAAQRA